MVVFPISYIHVYMSNYLYIYTCTFFCLILVKNICVCSSQHLHRCCVTFCHSRRLLADERDTYQCMKSMVLCPKKVENEGISIPFSLLAALHGRILYLGNRRKISMRDTKKGPFIIGAPIVENTL